MTYEQIDKKRKSIGSVVLFDIIMGIITLASFAVSIVSDYVKVGFDFSFLMSFSYWATLIANNVVNIAMCIAFRSVMRDRESRINGELVSMKSDIETAKRFIYQNNHNKELKKFVDERNAERKFKMYVEQIKRKADKSKARKTIDKYKAKLQYENDRAQPRPWCIAKYQQIILKNTAEYNAILSKLQTAREDSVWKHVKGYRPIRTAILFSTAEKIADNTADNYEVNNAKEFAYFFVKKIVFMLLFTTFLGTLVPQGFVFDYTLLWSTAVKIFWGAMSLYAGGSSGVEYIRQVLVPAVNGRTDFLQQFVETLPKKDGETLPQKENA